LQSLDYVNLIIVFLIYECLSSSLILPHNLGIASLFLEKKEASDGFEGGEVVFREEHGNAHGDRLEHESGCKIRIIHLPCELQEAIWSNVESMRAQAEKD